MSRYTPDSKDRVRDAVDMIALISTKTDLRRAGVNSYFGRCPFHEERTGSFHVRPEEKHYHCFGCQESGDPFDFVMQTEGLDFRGALESLADRFGVTLELEDEDPLAKARRERRERLHSLLDRAAAYYARYLWESGEAAPAREYLAKRGLADETLRTYRVGYSPSAWDKMLIGSRQAGFSEEELLATGLAQRSTRGQKGLYDRFRGRIMFPLADARGRVVGFGARAMRDNQRPKYLNTSEGEVFHKGSQLFGIDIARRAAARAGSIVLAEGYTDVLALHQAGVENAVGIMGTSLTEEQARELERTARTLVLALDSDRAGQEAMLRAARIAAGRRLELRVVPLPEGADPADLIQRDGAEAVRAQVTRSIPFVSFHVDRILARADLGDAEGKDRALAELAPVLAPLPPSVLREELVRRVAGRLDLSDQLAAQLLERHAANAPPPSPAPAAPARGHGTPPQIESEWNGPVEPWAGDPGPEPSWADLGPGVVAAPPVAALDRREPREREFLALCVAFPAEGSAALARVDRDQHFTSNVARRAAAHLQDRLGAPLDDLPDDDPELSRFVQALLHGPEGIEPTRAGLERAWLMLERARLDRAIEAARAAGSGVAALSRDKQQVLGQLRKLMEDGA